MYPTYGWRSVLFFLPSWNSNSFVLFLRFIYPKRKLPNLIGVRLDFSILLLRLLPFVSVLLTDECLEVPLFSWKTQPFQIIITCLLQNIIKPFVLLLLLIPAWSLQHCRWCYIRLSRQIDQAIGKLSQNVSEGNECRSLLLSLHLLESILIGNDKILREASER